MTPPAKEDEEDDGEPVIDHEGNLDYTFYQSCSSSIERFSASQNSYATFLNAFDSSSYWEDNTFDANDYSL